MQRLIDRLVALLSELKRRKVYRVLVVYSVGAYAVLELSDIVLPVLVEAPDTALALVIALVVAGLPIALLLGWMYDLTQAGLQRDPRDRRPVRYSRSGRLVGILMVVAASGLLGWASWSLARSPADAESRDTESEPDIPRGDPRRIAVLYLDDHSEDQDLDYLAAGLTESLIHELSSVPGLMVSSRNAVKPFRGEGVPIDSILRALDVGSLVEGSVTREGDRLRATIQLIDGRGSHLSSQVVEGPADSIFAFQDELADSVSRALRRRLGREIRLEGARAGTKSQEAWTLYQRAGALMEREERIEDDLGPGESSDVLGRADSLLERARQLDPDWAEPGVLRISLALRLAEIHGPRPGALDEAWADTAIARADRLLASHPRNPRALELRGGTRLRLATTRGIGTTTGDLLELARADLERSVRIDPDRATPWWRLSETLIYQNRYVEALEAAERAFESDVFLDAEESAVHGLFYTFLQFGPLDEADRWCARGYERFPRNPNFIRCKLLVLGTFPQVEPDVDRAWELFEELLDAASERSRGAWRLFGGMHVAQVLARAGLADSALSVLRAVRGDEAPAHAAGHEAKVHLLLGDEAEAIRMLESYLTFDTDTAYVAEDWWYEGLHENPRFRALVGLPERSGH